MHLECPRVADEAQAPDHEGRGQKNRRTAHAAAREAEPCEEDASNRSDAQIAEPCFPERAQAKNASAGGSQSQNPDACKRSGAHRLHECIKGEKARRIDVPKIAIRKDTVEP